jgi:hypothetical protein
MFQETHSGVSIEAEGDDLAPAVKPIRGYAFTLVIKHLVLKPSATVSLNGYKRERKIYERST